VRRALWFLPGIEFVVNFFPFPLAVEILLVPVLATIAVLGVLPSGTQGAAGARKFSEAVLALFGVSVFVRFVVLVVTDWYDFASSEALARFWIPPVLTIAVQPFFYSLGLYMAYEQAFMRLGFFMEGEPLLSYAKLAMVRRFGLNLGSSGRLATVPFRPRSLVPKASERSGGSFVTPATPRLDGKPNGQLSPEPSRWAASPTIRR